VRAFSFSSLTFLVGLSAAAMVGAGTAQAGSTITPGDRLGAAPAGSRPLLLAKKKKKKKKGATKAGAAPDSSSSGSDDAAGESDSSTDGASGAGATDEDVQKAARVSPKPSAGSDEGAGAESATKPRSKREASADDGDASVAAGSRMPRALDLAAGARLFERGLTVHQLAAGAIKEYQPRFLGDAGLALSVYPGAYYTTGIGANLGLEVNVEQAFGITSATADGSSYKTAIHDYNGSLRFRVPFEAFEGALFVGYGNQAFTLSGANRAALLLPDTTYKYVRAGLAVRVPLPSSFSISAGGGYRYVMSPGDIKTTYFPNLTVAGVEANAGVGYAITHSLEARAGVDLRRYFYSMHSKNGDPFIAGGAVDQTIAFTVSLAFLLDGSGGGAGGAGSAVESAPAPAPAAASDDKQPDGEVKIAPPPRRKRKTPKMEKPESDE
jgi:hypothetical protein